MQGSRIGYKWLVVATLWFICFLNYADRSAIFSLFPLLKTSLHLSDLELGIVGSSFMWMYALFGPVAGWLGDRWSRRWLIMGGLLLWIVLVFATSLAHSYMQLAVLRGLSGLGEAFYFPAAMSLISSWHGPETRSRAMSIHQSAVYLGSIGGGSLAGIMGQHLGWRSSFLFFGGLGVAVAVGVAFVFFSEDGAYAGGALPEPVVAAGDTGLLRTAGMLLGDARVVRLIVVFIGANFVAMAFMTWLPTLLHTKFHMTVGMAGVTGTLYLQLASVLGVITGGMLADKLVHRHAGGRMLTQALGMVAGVGFLFLTGRAASVSLLIAAMIGFGYCKGVYDSNIFASLYDVVPTQLRASAAGLMNSLGWLGGGFAPIAVALGSARYGMSASLSATSLIYLMLSMLLFYNARTVRTRSAQAPAA
ncbi:MFS transporter [Acidipila rosea]|uniref:Putative MFS family arabinose efflux permease n=1 Tax=Acidipila rosea TaxID=768535 RepID=A0A4R1LDV8_9BACT|nr:MFS transporter [Acidipila rosea]TCK75730.1 putative MFS family arabinose efflux permease [Acidipila rosea]